METFDFASELAEFQKKYPNGANLPLEDYASYLCDFRDLMLRHSFYHSGSREQLALVREDIREVKNALFLRIKSFPMNEETVRTLFLTSFLVQGQLNARIENLEDLPQRVEDLEGDLHSLKRELS
jgi:hypothetical protein